MGMQPAKELEHALSLVNQALHRNPNHIRGLSHKAILLARMGRFADGEPLVTRAAQIAPRDAEVLRLRSEYMTVQYWLGLMSAASMRSSQLVSSREYDTGNRRIIEETWRDPSPSQLSAASGVQQAALQMNRGALGAIQAAMQASAGTLEGSILRAEYEFHQQRRGEALAELQKGILLDTKSVLGWEALARYYLRTGHLDNEDEARSMAMNLYHTSAGPKLRIAWRAIAQRSWGRAQEVLSEAAKLDPADARVPAFQAVVAREKGDAMEYTRLLLKALSLEEARLSFDDSARSAGLSRSPTSLGLAMRLRFLLAGSGTDRLGLGIMRGAVEHAQRIKAPDGELQMWTAMLPEPQVEGNVPGISRQGSKRWPSSAQAMAVKAHMLYAKALDTSGHTEEAGRQRAFAAAYGPKLVPRNGSRPSSQWVFYGAEDDDGFGQTGVPPITRRPPNQ